MPDQTRLADFLPYLLSVTSNAVSDRIADEYRNAIDGVIENHEELVGLMSEINEQRYQIYTYMANSKGVEV